MQLNSVSNFEDGGEKAAHRVEGVRKVKRLWCRRRHRAPVHKFCDTQASNLLPSEQQVLGEDQQGCQMSSHTKKLTLKGHRKKHIQVFRGNCPATLKELTHKKYPQERNISMCSEESGYQKHQIRQS